MKHLWTKLTCHLRWSRSTAKDRVTTDRLLIRRTQQRASVNSRPEQTHSIDWITAASTRWQINSALITRRLSAPRAGLQIRLLKMSTPAASPTLVELLIPYWCKLGGVTFCTDVYTVLICGMQLFPQPYTRRLACRCLWFAGLHVVHICGAMVCTRFNSLFLSTICSKEVQRIACATRQTVLIEESKNSIRTFIPIRAQFLMPVNAVF